METNMVATFPVDGAWRPVRPAKQERATYAQFTVKRMAFAVVSAFGTWHHGFATEDNAKRFARSMHESGAIVMEVEPYWYCEAWGCVRDASVHAYDESAQMQHVRPESGNGRWNLGSDDSSGVGMRPVRIVCKID